MRRVLASLGVLTVLILLFAPVGWPQQDQPVGPATGGTAGRGSLELIATDCEVFRRVLFIGLREVLCPATEDSEGDRSSRCSSSRSPVGHVAVTYLPGYGLCASIEMRPSSNPHREPTDSPDADLWKELSLDVQAGRSLWESYLATRSPACTDCASQTDAAYSIATVSDVVIRTVAEHGHRIRGLQPQDRISVAVHPTGWGGDVIRHVMHSKRWDRKPKTGGSSLSAEEMRLAASTYRSLGDLARDSNNSASALRYYRRALELDPSDAETRDRVEALQAQAAARPSGPSNAPPVVPPAITRGASESRGHLVLTFSKQALDQYARGAIDLSALASACQVTTY